MRSKEKKVYIVTCEQFWRWNWLLWHFWIKFESNHSVVDECVFFFQNIGKSFQISWFCQSVIWFLNNLKNNRLFDWRRSHHHGWVNREESRPRQTKKRWKLQSVSCCRQFSSMAEKTKLFDDSLSIFMFLAELSLGFQICWCW